MTVTQPGSSRTVIYIWADPARKSCLALVAEDWKQLRPHVMSPYL